MADVQPFRGLRFNPQRNRSLSSLITPPYDVISEEQQREYYHKDPNNIIRLEFGREFRRDHPGNNRYTRSADTLNEWLRDAVLIQEERPAFYLIEHRFPVKDAYKSYWGLIASVRLEDFETGKIRPTEIIMKGPAEDRLQLLRSCRINTSSIMGIFDQKEGDLSSLFPDIDTDTPAFTGTDDSEVTFNMWIIDDPVATARVTEFFTGTVIYIADGHHRYTTALAFRDETLADESTDGSSEASKYLMMALISCNDDGLSLLPTHRLIRNIEPDQMVRLKDDLARYFVIQGLLSPLPESSQNMPQWMDALSEAGRNGPVFGLYGLEPGKCCLLTPQNASALYDMLPAEKPLAWKKLDVSLLHGIILQRILGIDNPEKEKECLEYSPDASYVLQNVDEGSGQLAVLLNPASISSVIAIADAGDRMPPKSTYFYPKTAAGLVMNPLF